MIEITIQTMQPKDVIDISAMVDEVVCKSGVKNGICLVFVPHATVGLMLNEFEPRIKQDYLKWFEDFFPKKDWFHNQIDDNAEAHLKSAIIGPSIAIPVDGGKLAKGIWQSILLCEFDGPRSRTFTVQVIGK